MLQGILRVLLTIMASSQGEDNKDDEMLGEEELGTQSPGSCAAQVGPLPGLLLSSLLVGSGCVVVKPTTRTSIPSSGQYHSQPLPFIYLPRLLATIGGPLDF